MRIHLWVSLLLVVAVGMVGGCKRKGEDEATSAEPRAMMKAGMASKAGAEARSYSLAEETASADPNAYYESTYQGGFGERERLAKLVADGIVIDGEQVKLAAFTRRYEQSFAVPTDKALALSAETELAKVVKEGGRTYLQVGLQAIRKEAPERAPLNLALVIDRSGSMGDQQKLEYAKQAAEDVVNRLESTDRLAIVTYDTDATVGLAGAPLRNKEAALAVIGRLRPGNSTNIHAGLTQGYREVREGLSPDAVNSVVLVSDGCITAGPADDASFRDLVGRSFDDGITTTTVGMGLDFNEHTMTLISREGKGNYHFINEPSAIAGIFDRELGDLTHVVAKAVRLRVALAPGVRLVRVLGSSQLSADETKDVKADERQIDKKVYEDLGIRQDRQEQPDEPGVKVVIPHFYLGDNHVVLLEIEIPRGSGKQKIADVYAKYKDVVFRQNREEHAVVSVDRARDKAAMVASVRRPVRKNRLGYETGEALLRAAKLLSDSRGSEAVKAVDDRMVVLGVAARDWQDQDIDADHELLGQYREVLASAARDPELGRYLAKSMTYSGYELTR